MLISLFVMVFLGMDLMLVLIFSSAVVLASSNLLYGSGIPWEVITQHMYSGIDTFTFTAIPLFVLAGELMSKGGITDRLINLSHSVVGHLRGSLGHTSVLLNMLMAGVSGSAVADATATGSIMIPAMKKDGYPPEKSAAIIAGSATIGPVIPPGITFIVLGGVAEISVGALFLSGIIPGILLGLAMMVHISMYAKKHDFPTHKRESFKNILRSFKAAILPLILPVIILGSIILGIASPTESAALGVLYALILCLFVYKSLNLKKIFEAFLDSILSSGLIMLIVGAGSAFGWIATYNNIDNLFKSIILDVSTSPIIVMFIIVFLLLILGTVIEVNPIILLVTPIIYPILPELGIDPIHFGSIMVITLTTALITPPVGINLFITSAIAEVPILSVAKAVIPFWVIIMGVVSLMIIFPQIALFIPNLFN